MASKKELTVEDRIKKEHRRLTTIYKNIEPSKKAIATGLTPFIVGDAVKIACAAICGKLLYPETLKLRAKLDRREKDE